MCPKADVARFSAAHVEDEARVVEELPEPHAVADGCGDYRRDACFLDAQTRHTSTGDASRHGRQVALDAEVGPNRSRECSALGLELTIRRLRVHARAVGELSVVHDDAGVDGAVAAREGDAAARRE